MKRSRTHARWGGVVGRGSVVNVNGQKGIVVRLLPLNNFSRAYGRQAVVAFYGPHGRVYEREVGVGDMTVLGEAKHVPQVHEVEIPRHPDEVAHHERSRDIRRAGQGVYYDPAAPHNLAYEKPLPPWTETRVKRGHSGARRRKRS